MEPFSKASAELFLFSGFWQIGFCLFAFAAMLAIWHHITRRTALRQRDPGMVWLAISVLVWVFAGWVDVVQGQQIQSGQTTNSPLTFDGLRSMLSILNSAFILLALPRFRHTPRLVRPIVQSDSWRWLVIISLIFALVLTLLMLGGWIIPLKYTFIYTIDLLYAVFTLFFLGLILWTSFAKRGLPVLAILSVLTIGFTLMAQILKLSDPLFNKVLFNCIFKSVLIMLFFSLALSWVEELSKGQSYYRVDTHALLLFSRKVGIKMEYVAVLTIPPFWQQARINLTEKNYQLLHRFAERRKDEPTEDGWLEIRPKSGGTKTFDIKDYNELNRLLENLLQGNPITPESEEDPKKLLKDRLFEYGQQRRIRLRIPPNQITLS